MAGEDDRTDPGPAPDAEEDAGAHTGDGTGHDTADRTRPVRTDRAAGTESEPDPLPEQATSVHPTAAHPAAVHPTGPGEPPEGATRRHEVPAAPGPRQFPHTPSFGTAPAPGGTGPWSPRGTAPFPGPTPGHGAPGGYGSGYGSGYGAGGYGPGGYGPGGYGPGGYGPGGHGPPTGPGGPGWGAAPWGPPQGGQPHGPPQGAAPWGPPPGGPPPPPPGRRRWLWVGIAGAVVLVLLVVTLVVVLTGQRSPVATVDAAAADLRTWAGATYTGRIPDGLGGQAALEVTVDRTGTATGSVTRASGGRLEFVTVGAEEAVRADRAWWARSASRPELVDRLTNVWLRDGGTQLPAGLGTWAEPPADLATRLTGPDLTEQDEQVVDGREARVFTAGDRRLLVHDEDPTSLVGVDLPGFGTGHDGPVTVHRSEPRALGALTELVPQVPTMKSYFLAITERPRLQVAVEGGAGACNTPTCTVTVRLVNSGTLATSGTIVVSLNGAEVARHPFSSAPGSTLTFPTTADNPVYSDPGARITALWLARVEGGR